MSLFRRKLDPFYTRQSIDELYEMRSYNRATLKDIEWRLSTRDYSNILGHIITSEWELKDSRRHMRKELKEIAVELKRRGRK